MGAQGTVSVSEYARRRGVHRRTVQKWLTDGRIERASGGGVDPDDADRRLRDYGASAQRASVKPAGGVTLAEARRVKEVALPTIRTLEARRLEGELVPVGPVDAVLFEWARELRDHWQSLPPRWAPDLAAEWGQEVRTVRVRLEALVRAGLQSEPALELAQRLARRGASAYG